MHKQVPLPRYNKGHVVPNRQGMTEKELLESLKKDDPSAIQYIFTRMHTSLCLLAYRMVKDHDQAKDIVQEVFIKLWRNRHELAITGSLAAYLRRAVVNTALNSIERKDRVNMQDLDHADLSAFAANLTEENISYQELTQKANDAIHNLPGRARVVFTLIRSEEMTYKEVAETLNISTKAVEKEMMKALRLLRDALKTFLGGSLIVLLMQNM
jgi:RNA polymerase sigma-70 factor, ECF subfamily